MTRLRAAMAALVALAAVLAVHPAGAASALPTEEDGIEVSADGETWQAAFPGSLFDPAIRMVPYDETPATFYVRSARDVPVVVAVVASNARSSSAALLSGLTLRGADGSGLGLAPTPLDELGECTELVPTREVQPFEVVRVDATLAMLGLTGTAGQGARADFDILVGMVDSDAATSACPEDPVLVPGTDPTPPGDGIPVTGAQPPYPGLVLGALAIGVGWVLTLCASRRRRRA